MKLSIGIVGLPNVGKSTLFNALLKRQVALEANYPFATIEPNIGIIEVPDDRLHKLAEIVKTQNPKGFIQNQKAAKQGGAVAGNARRELESRTGKKVVSTDNYLPEAKKNKELKKGKGKNDSP
mgnify:CR=1 FL=1